MFTQVRGLTLKLMSTVILTATVLVGGFFININKVSADTPTTTETPVVESTTVPIVTDTPAVEPSVETTTTPVETVVTPTTDQVAPVVETQPAENIITPEISITPTDIQTLPKEIWTNSGNKSTTNDSVEIGKTYVAPQNDQVTVTFTKLPENPGKLSIEEITLTSDQVASLGALSDKAYDITSDMADGTFAYDLTLPKPADKNNVQIKFSENITGLENADIVANGNIKTEADSVSASLDHFTIFVVVNPTPVSNLCVDAGVTNGTGCYSTIQAAIDDAAPGDTIKVYPGIYSETASGRDVNGANYQFGIFVGTDKNGLLIEGVDASGKPITNYKNVAATITTNATNDFGPSGVFISGNNITIQGLNIGSNISGVNKSIEVIGDNFTLQDSVISEETGGDLYINDFSGASNIVNKYNVLHNWFSKGATLDIANGAGASQNSLVADRQILGNTFSGAPSDWPYALISFNGTGGQPWYANTVGGAVIANNNFSDGTQYIRARGKYNNDQFNWKSYWDNNTFDKKVVDLSNVTEFNIQPFSYGTFTNVRRIGSLIQPEIDNAQVGDTIKVGAGTYDEQLNITKNIDLIGNSSDTTTIKTPASFTENSYKQKNIIEVNNKAIANISNVTVSGPGLSGCGSIHYGLYVIGDATLNLSDSKITNISDAPFSGCQNGIAIRVGQSSLSQSGTATINNVIITNYQKGGIVIDGTGSSAIITNNIITGAGNTPVTAQNGIQISRNATATISGNTITGNSYHLEGNESDWGATGILIYQSGAVTITAGNIISGNDLNIDKLDSGSLILHNNSIGLSTAPANVGFGVKNEDTDIIDATNNWWGSAVLTDVTAKINGNVTYKPYYIDEAKTTLSDVKSITAFGFQGLTPAVTGIISGTNITATVPFGTDVTALVPTITTTTGASVSPNGVAKDFTGSQKYTVTAVDGTTQDYTVTVTITAHSESTITYHPAVSYGGGSSSSNPITPVTTTTPVVNTTPTTPVSTPVVGKVLGAQSFNFTLTLKKGSKGNEVIELQKFLNAAGYDCGTADGSFGMKTKLAVIKLQVANNLKADGVVGKLTRVILNK